jgi:hypothetical protein
MTRVEMLATRQRHFRILNMIHEIVQYSLCETIRLSSIAAAFQLSALTFRNNGPSRN